MDWILRHLPLLVIVLVGISFLRTVMKAARRAQEEQARSQAPLRRTPGEDPEAAERTRRIQEEIRRKIEERRAGGAAVPRPAPVTAEAAPRLPSTPPIDTFGGPGGGILRKLQEAAARAAEQEAPPREEPPALSVVLERQQKLAEEMRALEAARQAELRRAADLAAAAKKEPAAATAARTARGDLLEDLRGAKHLRRAIVLREVLGAPVGLR